ncbi:MAG TPA: hypothetical protein VKT12_06905, partial [Candidatus Binataceae bacterium]|nr:hypothetical protein [Candidatus Binataceae bacterium]
MLAALGQHDAKRARRHFGIIEEQFVEVAHPVEQQAVRIGGLDLQILFHHRRDARRRVVRRLGVGWRGNGLLDCHSVPQTTKFYVPVLLLCHSLAGFPPRWRLAR